MMMCNAKNEYIRKIAGMMPCSAGELFFKYGSRMQDPDVAMKVIMTGYMQSFEEVCQTVGIDLDLTYDTAENLTPALMTFALFMVRRGDDPDSIKDVMVKTLATYLTLLAINNHDLPVSYRFHFGNGDAEKPLWGGGIEMSLSRGVHPDFLEAVAYGVDRVFTIDNGFVLDVAVAAGVYKALTGVSLSDYRFASLVIPYDDPEEEELLS